MTTKQEEYYSEARRTFGSDWTAFLRRFGARTFDLQRKGGEGAMAAALFQGFAAGHTDPNEPGVVATAKTMNRKAHMLSEWARCGFPEITCELKLAASLMSTKVHRDILPEDMGAPWGCFMLRLPENLIRHWAMTEVRDWTEPIFFSHAFVWRVSNGFRISIGCDYFLDAEVAFALTSLADIADETERTLINSTGFDDDPTNGLIQTDNAPVIRAQREGAKMLQRFILGAILELSKRSMKTIQGTGRERMLRAQARQRGAPKAWVFQLSRPVLLDCVERVRQAASGRNGTAVTMQSFVAGHWKNQPHGPGSTERKFIHIEPYWRGPEEAPIAVRPHILKGAVA